MTRTFTHAIFDRIYPHVELAPVPLTEAAAFYRASYNRDEPVRLVKVLDSDGVWCWGKAWFATGNHPAVRAGSIREGDLCTIGAGAYGDHTVWEQK